MRTYKLTISYDGTRYQGVARDRRRQIDTIQHIPDVEHWEAGSGYRVPCRWLRENWRRGSRTWTGCKRTALQALRCKGIEGFH